MYVISDTDSDHDSDSQSHRLQSLKFVSAAMLPSCTKDFAFLIYQRELSFFSVMFQFQMLLNIDGQ